VNDTPMVPYRSELTSSAGGSHAWVAGRTASMRAAKVSAPGASRRWATEPSSNSHGSRSPSVASVAKVSRCGHAPGGGNDSSGPRATSTTITASERTRTTASHRDADRSSVLLGREADQSAANARVGPLTPRCCPRLAAGPRRHDDQDRHHGRESGAAMARRERVGNRTLTPRTVQPPHAPRSGPAGAGARSRRRARNRARRGAGRTTCCRS